MSKLVTPFAVGATLAWAFLGAVGMQAHAAEGTAAASSAASSPALVTYVSGAGRDVGNCASPTRPCRTFQFAIDRTASGGDVKALDPANYGPVKFTQKSLSITGVDGAAIETNGGVAFSAAGGQRISVANLIIKNVAGTGDSGISISTGQSATIINCRVEGFDTGIAVQLMTKILISNTVVTHNKNGINISDLLNGTLSHVIANLNETGILFGKGTLEIVDTIANDNVTGVYLLAGNMFLARSTVIKNGTGLKIDFATLATSFGDNHIKGNGVDVDGRPLSVVGTQ